MQAGVVPFAPPGSGSGRPRPQCNRPPEIPEGTRAPDLPLGGGPAAGQGWRNADPGSVAGVLGEDSEDCVQINPEDLVLGVSVGSGLTAEVYRGTWKGQVVAIKQIDFHSMRRCTELKEQIAFAREVGVMTKVNHKNLVRFFGVSFTKPFRIITEFCQGDDCFQLLHNCCHIELAWEQKLKMCWDIASAMHYLHRFTPQIIHRDLKSLNLLLSKPVLSPADVPDVKVSDFGLARMKDPDKNWECMTRNAGTCHWMAPEVLTGNYNHKADIYSYGMVLFEIISREIPFDDEIPADVPSLTVRGVRPDLEAVPPDCPKELQKLMVWCWTHDPVARPEFSGVLECLQKIIDPMAAGGDKPDDSTAAPRKLFNRSL